MSWQSFGVESIISLSWILNHINATATVMCEPVLKIDHHIAIFIRNLAEVLRIVSQLTIGADCSSSTGNQAYSESISMFQFKTL